jgi:hypothetical protein
MRSWPIAVLLLACRREQPGVKRDPTPAKEHQPEIVAIHRAPPRAGMKSTIVKKSRDDMLIKTTSVQTTSIAHDEQRTEEVLAVDGSVVSKLRVTYDSQTIDLKGFGTGPAPTSSVLGRTYVVDSAKGAISVTDAVGKVPALDEEQIVKEDYDAFGLELVAVLPETPVKVGDPAPALAEALKPTIWRRARFKYRATIEASVERATTEAVTFAFRGQTTVDQLGMVPMTWDFEGKLIVRTSDGFPIEYSFHGPYTYGDDAGGTGSRSTSWKRTYF